MGILKGLWVTLKNFVTSYFCKPGSGGIFTVQYPEERCAEFENFRNFPFLVYDGSPDKIRCVACGICERECPPKCISITMATDAAVPNTVDQKNIKVGAGKPARRPEIFNIDYSLCMNCGMCEAVCPFDSIYMDHAFETTAMGNRTDLLKHKEDLLKSNDYFLKVRPTLAAAVTEKRRIAEEKKRAAAQPPQGPAL
ncbi:MAG TPA: 4Fe-4S binding protein [Candidatus Omnitrophota bacterium]|nr:4Fe-4S binding protein [Candidatus Omnitrophota bacterium]